jgi:hypothetical protein
MYLLSIPYLLPMCPVYLLPVYQDHTLLKCQPDADGSLFFIIMEYALVVLYSGF